MTITVTEENYMSVALALMFLYMNEKDVYGKWQEGTYNPSDDPLYPSELKATPTFEAIRDYVSNNPVKI